MRTLLNLARIRRIEFLVVELTILFLPILITIEDFSELANWRFAEACLLFFLLYTLGDVVNCLADRDLDATYKTHLSNAVYELGLPTVRGIVVFCTLASLCLALHLAAITGKWALVPLVVAGVFLGIGYSVKPVFFKGRGVLHLACLWLLLYFLPMLFAGLLVSDALAAPVIALAASYATVEMGVILVNTSEDYPEDRADGVITTAVALGLPRTMTLASGMVALGGAGFISTFALLFRRYHVPGHLFAALVLASAVWLLVGLQLLRLRRSTSRAPLEDAIRAVKAKGQAVPIWATAVGWAGVLCGLVLVYVR